MGFMMENKTFVDTVLSAMSEVVIYQDIEGKILWANEAARESLGLSMDDILGRYCFEARFDEDSRCEGCPVPDTLNSGQRKDREMVTPDGRHWHVQVYPHRSEPEGEITGLIEISRDITDAHRAREELRQDRQRFQRVTESVKAILWEYDIKADRWTYVSPQSEKLLGYSPEEWTDLDFWINSIHPEDRQWAVDYCMSCTARGEEHVFEYRFLKKDGGVAWLRDEVTVEMDDSEEPDRLRGFMVDITERKKTEKALQESQKNLEITLRSIGDGVIVTDPDGRVVRMNEMAEELTGWNFAETAQKPIQKIFQIDDTEGEGVRRPVHTVLQEKDDPRTCSDATLIARDGSECKITCTASPIKEEGEFLGVVVVFSDVTEQHRMKEQLRQSRNLIQATLDSLSANICVLDEKGDIISVNEPWIDFAMENDADMQSVQEGVNYLQICEQADGEGAEIATRFAAGIRSVMDGDRELFELEYPCHSPDEKRWFTGRVTRHVGYDDNPNHVVIAHENITERRLAEERLRFLSYHDSLTGLQNRAYLEQEMKRLDVPRQLPISIIMADVNGLKLVNDTFGHEEGDEVLKKVARILQTSSRQEDIVARWGGDEFLVLLPDTTSEQAKNIYQRILKACENVSQSKVPISISMGAATKKQPQEDIHALLKEAENIMYKRKLSKSRSTKNSILTTLLNTLGVNTHETEQHARRLQRMSLRLGEELGLSPSELDRLALVASLHDIGTVSISEDILTKTGPLSEEEMEAVRRHPEMGYRIVSSTEEFAHVASDILAHHEHWDGSGYPQGLQGREIPILARIVAVVDAYDAMTHHRPYRQPLSIEEALTELSCGAGTQFDPQIVEFFCELVEQGEMPMGPEDGPRENIESQEDVDLI